MGDMADYYIDQMPDRDWYPSGHLQPIRRIVCQKCGQRGYWRNNKGWWVLMQNKVPHICPPKDNTPEGFE